MDSDDEAPSGASSFGWAMVRPLPRHEERIYVEAPTVPAFLTAGVYLLEQLHSKLLPILPAMEAPLAYAHRFNEHHQEVRLRAAERGLLLADRWSQRDLGGVQIYLRREGYALLWREDGEAPGEWRGVLRHLSLPGAVAALGPLSEIATVIDQLGRRAAALTKAPLYARRAGEVASWCRAVVRHVREEQAKGR